MSRFSRVAAAGLGLGALTHFIFSSAISVTVQENKRTWLSENNKGLFGSYEDMAGATADQLFYAHSKGDHDSSFDAHYNAFLLCLIAMELRNGSEFQYQLKRLQEMSNKAFVTDANRFLAAAAYDAGRERPLHMVKLQAPEVVRKLHKSDREFGARAEFDVKPSVAPGRGLLFAEYQKCHDSRFQHDESFCQRVDLYVKKM